MLCRLASARTSYTSSLASSIINDYATLFRTYDARTGRWTSHDPILQPWESIYAGLAGNPAMLTDWYGLTPGGGGGSGSTTSEGSSSSTTTSTTPPSTTTQPGGGQTVVPMLPMPQIDGIDHVLVPDVEVIAQREPQFSLTYIPPAFSNSLGYKPEHRQADATSVGIREPVPDAQHSWTYTLPKASNSLGERPERSPSDATATKQPLEVQFEPVPPPITTTFITRPTFSLADAERARLALERQRILEYWGGPAVGSGIPALDVINGVTYQIGMLGTNAIASRAGKPLAITPAPRFRPVRPSSSIPGLLAFQKPLSLPGVGPSIIWRARQVGVPGKNSGVRVVVHEAELRAIFDQLSAGGLDITPPTYEGKMVKFDDGTTVGLRNSSKSGGPTIDIVTPNSELKIHTGGRD